jgi:hypothetical protein
MCIGCGFQGINDDDKKAGLLSALSFNKPRREG